MPSMESPIDFTDLELKYKVEMDERLDAFVAVDNLPIVDSAKRTKLLSVIAKIFKKAGSIREDGISMPMKDDGSGTEKSLG